MERYLAEFPEYTKTYNTMKMINERKHKDLDYYLEDDDAKMYKYVYRLRLYRNKEVNKNFKKIKITYKIKYSCNYIDDHNEQIRDLRNSIYRKKSLENLEKFEDLELKIIRMFLNEKVYFDNFDEKLMFIKNFNKFEKNFVDEGDCEYELQSLYYSYISRIDRQIDDMDDIIMEVNDLILNIKNDKMVLYFFFLQDMLSEETIRILFDLTSIRFKHLYFNKIDEEVFYIGISKVLLEETTPNKIMFLHTFENLDKIKLYKNLSVLCMSRSDQLKKYFVEYINLMKICTLEMEYSLCAIVSWLKAFIFYKNIDEFYKLYKQLLDVIDKKKITNFEITYETGEKYTSFLEEIGCISELYTCIIQYKRTNTLDFKTFIDSASKIRDNNIFSYFRWRDIIEVYK